MGPVSKKPVLGQSDNLAKPEAARRAARFYETYLSLILP
jgi:hypothetical protein